MRKLSNLECLTPEDICRQVVYCNGRELQFIITSDANLVHNVWGRKQTDCRGEKLFL